MTVPVTRPGNLPVPFAYDGDRNVISVLPASPNASLTAGFPPVTMRPLTAGGIPPQGKDFNGIFYDITSHTVWVNAGGQYLFDDTLSTAIGGYPAGMVLQADDGFGSYVSVTNNNTDNFNTTVESIGLTWMPWAGNSGAVSYVIASGTGTPISSVEACATIIRVLGGLSADETITFPTVIGKWIVENNTTGGFRLLCNIGIGDDVIVEPGSVASLASDGTTMFYADSVANQLPKAYLYFMGQL